MLRFYYNPGYKYTNRTIIDISSDTNYREIDYENIDSPDTINGHIIYKLAAGESIPTYVYDTESHRRYYVSGITQLRTGKFQISLLRDIISENPEVWKTERAYISAGLADNYNKYKRWDLPFTNTKIDQQRLPINGKPSFFVFYVNEQNVGGGGAFSESDLEVKYSAIPGVTSFDYTITDISDIPSYEYIGAGNVINWTRHKAEARIASPYTGVSMYGHCEYTTDSLNGGSFVDLNSIGSYRYQSIYLPCRFEYLQSNFNNWRSQWDTAVFNFLSTYESSLGTQISNSAVADLSDYVGKIIYNSVTNKVYRLKVTTTNKVYNRPMYASDTSTLVSAIRNINFGPNYPNASPATVDISNSDGPWISIQSESTTYNYVMEEIGTATTFDFTFKANTRKLPKSAVRCVNIVSDNNHSDSEIAQMLMLAQTNGYMDGESDTATTGRILDIQYLPFSVAENTNTDFEVNTNEYLIAEYLDEDDYTYFTNLTDLTDMHKETDTIKIVSPQTG